VYGTASVKQEAFEKCWSHSPLRAAARRCPQQQQRRRRQRQRVTEMTAMAPWNGPKYGKLATKYPWIFLQCRYSGAAQLNASLRCNRAMQHCVTADDALHDSQHNSSKDHGDAGMHASQRVHELFHETALIHEPVTRQSAWVAPAHRVQTQLTSEQLTRHKLHILPAVLPSFLFRNIHECAWK